MGYKILHSYKRKTLHIPGRRDGDPGANYQDSFSPTDGDWPRIMRVNPILKWRYQVKTSSPMEIQVYFSSLLQDFARLLLVITFCGSSGRLEVPTRPEHPLPQPIRPGLHQPRQPGQHTAQPGTQV